MFDGSCLECSFFAVNVYVQVILCVLYAGAAQVYYVAVKVGVAYTYQYKQAYVKHYDDQNRHKQYLHVNLPVFWRKQYFVVHFFLPDVKKGRRKGRPWFCLLCCKKIKSNLQKILSDSKIYNSVSIAVTKNDIVDCRS